MKWSGLLLGLEYETHGNNDKAMECMSRATTINDQFQPRSGNKSRSHICRQTRLFRSYKCLSNVSVMHMVEKEIK